jgi:glycosyltransferase AglD
MKKSPDLSLILPCYNEEPIFEGSVKRIITVLEGTKLNWEIIFVDDKSSDNTVKLIRSVLRANKRCKAIFHAQNIGRGAAVTDGIRSASGQVVGYIDIDLEVSPIYIPEFVRKIHTKEADMVIGKRIYRTTFGSIIREVLSIGYQNISRHIVETRGFDTESGYKFFDRKKIIPILKFTQNKHWFWDTEIIVYAHKAKLKICEEPVLFLRRFDKKSSVNILEDTVNYIIELSKLARRF